MVGAVCDKNQLPRTVLGQCCQLGTFLGTVWDQPSPSAVGVIEGAQLGLDSCPLDPAREKCHCLPSHLSLRYLQGQLPLRP